MSINRPVANTAPAEFIRAEAEFALDEARKQKAIKNKDLGDPIDLNGVPICLQIRGDHAWLAENTHMARKLDLKTGRTVQLYKGHTGPVTSLAFCDKESGSGDTKILITGSWDNTIKLWDTDTKALLSSTPAHSDFVKALLVIPSLNLLVSDSSDKSVRFWDLSSPMSSDPLRPLGSISSHTRPVEALDAYISSENSKESPTLFTSDSMGTIKAWDLRKEGDDGRPIWKSTLKADLPSHRTGVNEVIYGDGHLWSASTDETVRIHPYPPTDAKTNKPFPPISEKKAVKSILPLQLQPYLDGSSFPYLLCATGDVIRVYDVSSLDEPELVREVEGHWHDVTSLRLWLREREDGKGKEVWIVSGGLDRTLRRWRLSDLLAPPTPSAAPEITPKRSKPKGGMTEDEEKMLAELMDDDDDD
ncbi:WD40 repeat-like protein [Amylostereum chailletii]|nr:WD40 repeat-like protein [Amylostereum chailletii]